jgi:hypothetical protein
MKNPVHTNFSSLLEKAVFSKVLSLDIERVFLCNILIDIFFKIPELRTIIEEYESLVFDKFIINHKIDSRILVESARSLLFFGETCISSDGVLPSMYIEKRGNSLFLWICENSLISTLSLSGSNTINLLMKNEKFLKDSNNNVFLDISSSSKLF